MRPTDSIDAFGFLLLLASCAPLPEALAIDWSGGGDGTTYADADNWDGVEIPDNGSEDARFNLDATFDVVLGTGSTTSIGGLLVEAGDVTLTLPSSTATLSPINASVTGATLTLAEGASGGNVVLNTSNDFTVGDGGVLSTLSGSRVTVANQLLVGDVGGAAAQVTVDGAGSTFVAFGDFHLGADTGTSESAGLTVSDQAVFTVSGTGATTIDNTGVVNINTGAQLDVGGALVMAPGSVLMLDGGTLLLSGATATSGLNQAGFVRNGGLFRLRGELDNTGATLFTTTSGGAAGQVGLLELDDGKITGGTVQGDLRFDTSSDGELDNVSVIGNLDLSSNFANLDVTGGLNHGGALTLGGTSDLSFRDGSNVLVSGTGTGSVIQASSGSSIFITSDSAVTFDSGVTIEGDSSIFVSTGSFTNDGNLLATTGTSVVSGGGWFTNTGTIRVDTGAAVDLNLEDWTSASGVLHVNGGTMRLDGAFTTADLNQPGFLRNGGLLLIDGGLDNTGATLFTTTSGGAAGQVGLARLNGGTITGGVVQGDLEYSSSFDNELDGLRLVGDLIPTFSNSRLKIVTSLSHEGIITLNNGGRLDFRDAPNLLVSGTGSGSVIQAVSGSLIIISSGVGATFDSGITVQGDSNVSIATGSSLTNDGALLATTGTSVVGGGGSFTNTGTIRVDTGATFDLNLNDWTSAAGVLHVNGGTMRLDGAFTTADLNQPGFISNGGLLLIDGELDNTGATLFTTTNGGAAGQVGLARLNGGSITGGSVHGDLEFNSSTSELDDVSVVGDLIPGSFSADLNIATGLRHEGVITLSTVGDLNFRDGTNVLVSGTGTGSVIQAGPSNTIEVSSGTAVTFDSGVTVEGDSTLFIVTGSILTNGGNLLATSGTSVVTGGGSFANTGTVRVDAGATFDLNLNDWTSAAGVLHVNGGTMRLDGAFTTADLNQPAFLRTGGQLLLDGQLDNTGATLFTTTNGGAAGQVGLARLNGGSITGGSVHGDLEYGFSTSNKFDGVTLVGDLIPTSSASQLEIANGLSHEGFMTLGIIGDLTFRDGTNLLVSGTGAGSVIQSASTSTVNVLSSTAVTFDSGVTVEGGALFFVTPGSSFTNGGNLFATTGTTTVGGAGSFANTGTIRVDAGAEFNFNIGATFLNDGAIEGDGTLVADLLQNAGLVSPGSSAGPPTGQLELFGDFVQAAGGELSIEIGGMTQGVEYDSLNITGAAALGGTLEVSLIDGFAPAAGDTFELLAAAGVTGVFDTETLPQVGGLLFDVVYGADSLLLAVSGVAGDYNFDGVVNAADYLIWREAEGQTGAGLAADGDFDGDVDTDDYNVWSANYGKTALFSVSVPEPCTIFAALFGLVLTPRRNKFYS